MALFENKPCIECSKITLMEYDKDECIECRVIDLTPEDEILQRLADIRDLIIALNS